MFVASGWQAICASRRVPVFSGLSPLPCALIQRNRFSLTHAMDTLIPSSRPPIPINFTDRRNIPETRWELTTRVGTRQRTRIGESGNDLSAFTICQFFTLLLPCQSPSSLAELAVARLSSSYPSRSTPVHLSRCWTEFQNVRRIWENSKEGRISFIVWILVFNITIRL